METKAPRHIPPSMVVLVDNCGWSCSHAERYYWNVPLFFWHVPLHVNWERTQHERGLKQQDVDSFSARFWPRISWRWRTRLRKCLMIVVGKQESCRLRVVNTMSDLQVSSRGRIEHGSTESVREMIIFIPFEHPFRGHQLWLKQRKVVLDIRPRRYRNRLPSRDVCSKANPTTSCAYGRCWD